MEQQLTKPMSVEDMIILQAQSVKELKTKVDVLEHRINTIDKIDTDGSETTGSNG